MWRSLSSLNRGAVCAQNTKLVKTRTICFCKKNIIFKLVLKVEDHAGSVAIRQIGIPQSII
jgi:hypothetical protein